MAALENNGAEVSIPSSTSDEMMPDENRRDLAITAGNHRAMQTPMNIMSMNTTIVPPNQGQRNLEPQSELFNQMWAQIQQSVVSQAQEALRHQWQCYQQSAAAQHQASQQNLEIAAQNERAFEL